MALKFNAILDIKLLVYLAIHSAALGFVPIATSYDLLNAIQALSQLSYTPMCGKEPIKFSKFQFSPVGVS